MIFGGYTDIPFKISELKIIGNKKSFIFSLTKKTIHNWIRFSEISCSKNDLIHFGLDI